MQENYEICHCMGVSYSDVEDAMHSCEQLHEVEALFKKIQDITACSTGCGGCHDKVMNVISELLSK